MESSNFLNLLLNSNIEHNMPVVSAGFASDVRAASAAPSGDENPLVDEVTNFLSIGRAHEDPFAIPCLHYFRTNTTGVRPQALLRVTRYSETLLSSIYNDCRVLRRTTKEYQAVSPYSVQFPWVFAQISDPSRVSTYRCSSRPTYQGYHRYCRPCFPSRACP